MGATDLDQFRRQANAQNQAQAQLQAALQMALQNPHTIHRLQTVAVGVGMEGAQRVLWVGTPDGQRYDIPLGGPLAASLVKALSVEEQVS